MKYAGIVGTVESSNQILALESNPIRENDNSPTESTTKSIEDVLNRADAKRSKEVME